MKWKVTYKLTGYSDVKSLEFYAQDFTAAVSNAPHVISALDSLAGSGWEHGEIEIQGMKL